MDASRFDAWTRRRFGGAAGGLAVSLLALAAGDDTAARKRKRSRKKGRKRRKKQPHVCAGRNHCETVATCHHPSAEVQCFCFVTVEGGKPFCSIGMLLTDDCSECAAGQTCVDASGGRCGAFAFGCADPCPKPR
jgi:hypothetical protein